MENLSFGSSRPIVLGCSCANRTPPSFVPTRPSALSGPCQTSFHLGPVAMTPGIAVIVTSRSGVGCLKFCSPPVFRCCATAISLRTRTDARKQQAIVHIAFSFISSPGDLDRNRRKSALLFFSRQAGVYIGITSAGWAIAPVTDAKTSKYYVLVSFSRLFF